MLLINAQLATALKLRAAGLRSLSEGSSCLSAAALHPTLASPGATAGIRIDDFIG